MLNLGLYFLRFVWVYIYKIYTDFVPWQVFQNHHKFYWTLYIYHCPLLTSISNGIISKLWLMLWPRRADQALIFGLHAIHIFCSNRWRTNIHEITSCWSFCVFDRKHRSYDHGQRMSPTFIFKSWLVSHVPSQYWTDWYVNGCQANNDGMVTR